jgi:hypothetical protein
MGTHDVRHTYSAGFLLMALARCRDPVHEEWIEELAETLQASLPSSGLWAYPDREKDLSNTLVAVLGLDLAVGRGVDVSPRVWLSILDGTLTALDEGEGSGAVTPARAVGFSYRPHEKASGSMTAAGITVLELCRRHLGTKLSPVRKNAIDRIQEGALLWLGEHFALATNPPNRSWHEFHMWGYERVGALLGVHRIGEHDWYEEGARHLLGIQRPAGNWYGDLTPTLRNRDAERFAELQTAMALVFLSRSTAGVTSGRSRTQVYATEDPEAAIRLRATGDTPLTIWLETAPPGARLVEYFARPVPEDAVAGEGAAGGGDPEAESFWIQSSDEADRGFPVQYAFPHSGPFEVWAEVAAGDDLETSAPLRVAIERVLDEALLRYATDRARNLLAGIPRTVTASSFRHDLLKPEFAFDKLCGRDWQCAADDPAPWISLELEETVKGNVLAFTHPQSLPARDASVLADEIEVTLNARDPVLLRMPARRDRKAELELRGKTPVRSLAIRILSTHGGERAGRPVGLGEVELFYER